MNSNNNNNNNNDSKSNSTITNDQVIIIKKTNVSTSTNSNKKRSRQQQHDNNVQHSTQQQQTEVQVVPITNNVQLDIPYKSNHYHISYMHQSILSVPTITSIKHGYIITGDTSGIVKFWKRIPVVPNTTTSTTKDTTSSSSNTNTNCCIEFVKSFVAHTGPVQCLCIDTTGDTVVSIGLASSSTNTTTGIANNTSTETYIIKWYDVVTFDVIHMITTASNSNSNITLGYCSTLFTTTNNILALAVSSKNNSNIYIYVIDQLYCVQTIQLHNNNSTSSSTSIVNTYITSLLYIPHHNCIVSTDTNSIVEVWDCIIPTKTTSTSTSTSTTGSDNLIDNYNSNDDPIDDEEQHQEQNQYQEQQQYTLSIGKGANRTYNNVQYQSKFDTDYIVLLKKKVYPITITYTYFSNTNTTYYAMYCSDRKIRIFNHCTGVLCQTIDDRLSYYDTLLQQQQQQQQQNHSTTTSTTNNTTLFKSMDHMEYGKRIAVERVIQNETSILSGPYNNSKNNNNNNNYNNHQIISIQFDITGHYLYVPSLLGILIWDWQKRTIISIVGSADSTTIRFLSVCIASGNSQYNQQLQLSRYSNNNNNTSTNTNTKKEEKNNDNNNNNSIPNDSLVIATAYDQRRLYVFSHYDPIDNSNNNNNSKNNNNKKVDNSNNKNSSNRDVWNEPPTAQDQLYELRGSHANNVTTDIQQQQHNINTNKKNINSQSKVVIRTTMGDIYIQLYPEYVPKTIENFVGHIRNQYYDNTIFHRIIKNFMIQTGDPLGDGTGGESIWGNEFIDEIRTDVLVHDKPYIVSMANSGPNTNGSQFFITTIPTPWLDGKHTIFGTVYKGMDICNSIENVTTNPKNDKPLVDIRIINIDIL